MNQFNCSGCCCYFVDVMLDNIAQINDTLDTKIIFPYSHNNGRCEKLMENSLCAVYEYRPIVCNVQGIGEIVVEKTGLSIETIFEQHKTLCKMMQKIKIKNLYEYFKI